MWKGIIKPYTTHVRTCTTSLGLIHSRHCHAHTWEVWAGSTRGAIGEDGRGTGGQGNGQGTAQPCLGQWWSKANDILVPWSSGKGTGHHWLGYWSRTNDILTTKPIWIIMDGHRHKNYTDTQSSTTLALLWYLIDWCLAIYNTSLLSKTAVVLTFWWIGAYHLQCIFYSYHLLLL